jgi:quercetin dioxygenase-like cupin family protein
LILAFFVHPDGVATGPGNRVVYDVERDEAHFGAARVGGLALRWELMDADPEPGARLAADVELAADRRWIVRCDRIDFPPGAVAYRHTHPGPGIRCLLFGSLRIESGGETHEYGALEPWFESGPEPVLAVAAEAEPTSFVRVLLLPHEWEGRRTIRYVDPADEAKPKRQRARVFFDRPLAV